jgi:hypothetical protein
LDNKDEEGKHGDKKGGVEITLQQNLQEKRVNKHLAPN